MNQHQLGGELPIDQQYEIRVKQETMKPFGVRAPGGTFYPFTEGEELVWERGDGGIARKGIIRVVDGDDQDLQEWMLKQDQRRL